MPRETEGHNVAWETGVQTHELWDDTVSDGDQVQGVVLRVLGWRGDDDTINSMDEIISLVK